MSLSSDHVLERGKPHERNQIISTIIGSIVQLSQHKFTSNVVEKCLQCGDSTAREMLIKNNIGHGDKNDNLLPLPKSSLNGFRGKKVIAIIYDANIIALADELTLGKTYMLSNATVKDNRNEFRGSLQDKIWTITAKTKIKELKEDNLNFLFSRYELTGFNKLERCMDSNAEISVIGIAIEVRQKRIIQTQFGTQTCLQDVVLIDKSFETIILTMWDTFVENDCVTITDNIESKPIIWTTNLKVSSYNGVTLSTKVNSTFTLILKLIETNKEKLDKLIEEKPSIAVTPLKISPPDENKFTPIADLQGAHLGVISKTLSTRPLRFEGSLRAYFKNSLNFNLELRYALIIYSA
ncbi:replication protein A 70 kDa DNA-binding subunit B-like [Olea europaea var. sylvestris]|nr:replication protein A 70 kDa DNA-binding subunit B-like [Olea europaea var. sylvestris]